jgi:hypothetical protein
VYVFDRKNGVFYWLNFEDQKWGGYSIGEFEELNRAYHLAVLAQRPELLRRLCARQERAS